MKTYSISLGMRFVFDSDVTDEHFENLLDYVLDQFDGMDVETPDLTASLANRVAYFSGVAKGEVFEDAVHKFASALRAALHGTGGSTPDWPQYHLEDRIVRELEDA